MGERGDQGLDRRQLEEPSDAVFGQPARRGRAQHHPGDLGGRPLGHVGEGGHCAHGMSDQDDGPADVQVSQDGVEVVSELVDAVGVGVGGPRVAVTAVVVTDDPRVWPEAAQCVPTLDTPRVLAQTQSVEEHDGAVSVWAVPVGHRD